MGSMTTTPHTLSTKCKELAAFNVLYLHNHISTNPVWTTNWLTHLLTRLIDGNHTRFRAISFANQTVNCPN